MSQLPFVRIEYATVLPSGDSAGDVSSPAASVRRLKFDQAPSAAGGAGLISHAAAAASSATAAMLHGNQAAPPFCGTAGASMARDDDVDAVASVSSAKARSVAD